MIIKGPRIRSSDDPSNVAKIDMNSAEVVDCSVAVPVGCGCGCGCECFVVVSWYVDLLLRNIQAAAQGIHTSCQSLSLIQKIDWTTGHVTHSSATLRIRQCCSEKWALFLGLLQAKTALALSIRSLGIPSDLF